jgi:cation-transporting ATPase 13A3/4/5
LLNQLIRAKFNKVKEVHTELYIDNEKGVEITEKIEEKSSSNNGTSQDDVSSVENDENMVIHTYKRTWIGDIALVLFGVQTIGQIAYMIMLTSDYYTSYAMFRGFAIVQSSTFMGQWYIFFIWFACVAIFRYRLPNFFRIRCNYGEGQYVQVERQEPALIFLEDQSDKLMDLVRKFEEFAKHMAGLDVMVTNAPLRYTSGGTKYFVYQCTRYVYHPETELFSPHQFHLGDTNAELAILNNGLSSQEAASREELIGPNFIEVYVPNFVFAMFQEFSSFFYIYQFSILWLFYYFAYCKYLALY